MKLGILSSALMVGGLVFCRAAMASDLESVHKPEAPGVPGTQVVDPLTGLGSYIVRLDVDPQEVGPEAAHDMVMDALSQTIGTGRSQSIYTYAMVGFSAWMTPEQAADLGGRPAVALVQPNRWMSMNSERGLETNPNEPSPWNLRRISAPDGLAPDYEPCGSDGTGVTAVIIDSGFQLDQSQFAGRIREALSFADTPGGDDAASHGTHVAGTMAGTGIGVAPACEIVALSVANANNAMSDDAILDAIDWLMNPVNMSGPSVVNMSFGSRRIPGDDRDALFYPLMQLVRAGYVLVAAAGNDSYPASWASPAGFLGVICVGATDVFDRPAAFSNFGSVVDIWAPGAGILSANSQYPDGGVKLESGTSQAAPCVAGVAALFLERHVTSAQMENEPGLICARAHISMVRSAAVGVLQDVENPMLVSPGGNSTLGGSANRLVQACDQSGGIECVEETVWSSATKSIILGDGIEPIPGTFACNRVIRNTKGPVSLTVNTMAIAGLNQIDSNPATSLTIEDVATGEMLWTSHPDSIDGADAFYRWSVDRTVTSTTRQGLRVMWNSNSSTDFTGYGYVMTANVAGTCPADLADDGEVGISDLLIVLEEWGGCDSGSPCVSDIDGNGFVNADDLLIVVSGWGPCDPYTLPGFIRDCNGNQVPAGLLGDGFLDDGVRQICLEPVLDGGDITTVDLNCEALQWDTLEGNPSAISPDDPRAGACSFVDGSCQQLTYDECMSATGSVFLGRGVPCEDQPVFYSLGDAPCLDVGSQVYGWPIPLSAKKLMEDSYTTYRQLVEPGLYSVSRLAWIQRQPRAVSGTNVNVNPTGKYLLMLPRLAEISLGITIYYRDGGDPDFIRRVASLQPVVEYEPESFGLYVVEDLLPAGDREIHSIRIAADPDGLQTQASMYRTSNMLGISLPTGSVDPIAEQTVDGGRTWHPVETDEGQNAQITFCVTP